MPYLIFQYKTGTGVPSYQLKTQIVSYADSTTGGSPVVSLYDASYSEIASASLGHELAGTIQVSSPIMIDGGSPTRSGYVLLPQEEGSFGDPMTLYLINESGVLTAQNTDLDYLTFRHGTVLDTNAYPYTYPGMVGTVSNINLYATQQQFMLRQFVSDADPSISAYEVVNLTNMSVIASHIGTENAAGSALITANPNSAFFFSLV